MSLSSFIEQPQIRERLRQDFRKPSIRSDQPLLGEPRSKRYALVGTAFDYLLRFLVQRLNPHAGSRRWIAEDALRRLGLRSTDRAVYNIGTEELSFQEDDSSFDIGRELLKKGQAAHKRYLETGSATDSVLRGVLGLAQLDTFYRCGKLADDFGTAHREDMRDLQRLISLVNPDLFHARRTCFLNPGFGVGSRLVRGADADLFIDGALIEIKTTARADFSREHFNQLLGYLAMLETWGIVGTRRRWRVSKIGIYFARHASMQLIDVGEIATREKLVKFNEWFRGAIERSADKRSTGRTQPTSPEIADYSGIFFQSIVSIFLVSRRRKSSPNTSSL